VALVGLQLTVEARTGVAGEHGVPGVESFLDLIRDLHLEESSASWRACALRQAASRPVSRTCSGTGRGSDRRSGPSRVGRRVRLHDQPLLHRWQESRTLARWSAGSAANGHLISALGLMTPRTCSSRNRSTRGRSGGPNEPDLHALRAECESVSAETLCETMHKASVQKRYGCDYRGRALPSLVCGRRGNCSPWSRVRTARLYKSRGDIRLFGATPWEEEIEIPCFPGKEVGPLLVCNRNLGGDHRSASDAICGETIFE
jgi:hypothetical protein